LEQEECQGWSLGLIVVAQPLILITTLNCINEQHYSSPARHRQKVLCIYRIKTASCTHADSPIIDVKAPHFYITNADAKKRRQSIHVNLFFLAARSCINGHKAMSRGAFGIYPPLHETGAFQTPPKEETTFSLRRCLRSLLRTSHWVRARPARRTAARCARCWRCGPR
jgi:hypothetical protein